jgi:DNA-binding LytR/AlgR family response regulator
VQTLLAEWAQQTPRAPTLEYLQASVGKEVRMIRTQDVVYFESDAGYTRVVYRREGIDADALIRTPLKVLLSQIDGQRFVQVHRSIVVNQDHIVSATRVDDSVMHLVLQGRPERLPVSRHFQALFKGQ